LILLPVLAVTAASSTASAADDSAPLFTALPAFSPSASDDAGARPTQFKAYRADLAGIRAQLAGGRTTLSIPDPAGTPTDFSVVEDSAMEPALQAAHPEIRTYAGSASNGTTIRLDVTPLGFHAMVRRPDGVAWYVEPATRAVGENRVLSFAGATAGDAPSLVEQQVAGATDRAAAQVKAGSDFSTPGGLVTQRTFRLALVTDYNYADYVLGGNVTDHATDDSLVLAAKTSLVNRVNEAYNDDVAYKFVMVDGTDTKLNFLTEAEMTGDNGPCGPNACFPDATGPDWDCFSVLERNDFVLGQIIGADKYDIGHIGVGVNGGGVAGLGVVGSDEKAVGCTGIPTPVGDVYAIDYVAHEMGHQMGGDHTFDGPQGNCGPGNRNPSTSVEPGSGTTIMAYAGICGTDNLQPHSDPYFSFKSIDEFEATTAETRAPLHERQSVAMTGLANGEQLTISCASGCTPTNVTFDGNSSDKADIAAAIQTATGTTGVTVSNYDTPGTSSSPSVDGFTATWADSVDHPTITVTGPFTALIGTLVQGGAQTNGGTTSVTANHSPVVTVPANKTIPTRTPFTLTGSATDADLGDTLTYDWEQTDTGGSAGTGLVNNNKTDGPLFRVFGTYAAVTPDGTITYHSPGENLAGTSPSRTFPDLAQVLAGNTNAATGTCPTVTPPAPVPVPVVDCYSEFLPTSAYLGTGGSRVLNFRLTARDEFSADPAADHPGGVSWGNMALAVDPTAGPFLVTSRVAAGTASGVENVTWSVAGTNTASMAQNVKISLSTDGGSTFPTVLANSTPNDGSQSLVLPSVTTSTARIKVEAVGNYFFDINDSNFTINPAPANVAPLVDAGPDATVRVNTPFTSAGSLSDETPATASATVDYGDGAGPQPLALTGTSYSLIHTYTSVGVKTVTVRVTDTGGLSSTDTVQVTVTPAPLATSAVKAASKPKKPIEGRAFKVKATVTTASGVPAGTVQVYLGAKLLGTGTLKNGKVSIKLSKKKAKKLKAGKNTLTAKYLGSATVAASQADFVVKVKKKKH
jgi:hypothetical protein